MPVHNNLAGLLHEAVAGCGDAATSMTVAGGPVRLRIRCADAAILERLQAVLAPSLMVAPTPVKEAQDIRVVLDPGLARRLEHAVTADGPYDDASEPHRVWDGVHLVRKQAGGSRERRSAYLLWAEDDPWASCIVLSGPGTPADTLSLRLVRGVAARVMLAAGWIPLHAACMMTRAGAVCLLGAHGSGKTTALLHLLKGAAGPVALVANSIVLLSPHGPAEVRTLPTAIGLRAPSIELFPELDPLVSDTGAAPDTERKVYLPAARIAEVLGVPQSAGGPLTAFISVDYRGAQQSTWRPLTTQQREAGLRHAYLPDGLMDDPHEHARLDEEHRQAHHRRLRQYAGSTAAAVLETGMDAAQVLGAGLADLLAQAAR